jgi:HSP20 family protein
MTLAPFRGFWDMQSEVDRLFNDMVGDQLGRRREGFARERLWAPRLEAFAREGDLVIHADLPGVALDDVDITLEGTTLTISGERKLPAAGDGIDYYLRENPSGAFRRSVVVPEDVDPDSIKARLENGVLELVLPDALAEIQPKKIAIEGGEGPKSVES